MPSSTSSSKGPRALLGRLGAFLGLTLLLLAALEFAVRAMVSDPYALKYAQAYQSAPPHAHQVWGASPAMQGIHPRYMEASGLSVFNFAYSGGNPRFYQHWYAIYRQVNPAPRLVIYATDWFMFRRGFLGRSIATDAAYLPPASFLGLFSTPGVNWKLLALNRPALIKYRVEVKNSLFLQTDPPEDAAYYKGCWTLSRAYRPLDPIPLDTDAGLVASFHALLDTLRADGVRVILVQPPTYAPDAGEHGQEQAHLQAIARERGLTYLNYNGERASALNYDRRHFTDWLHISAAGAERFSRRLGEDMAALGLNSERGREEFSGVSR